MRILLDECLPAALAAILAAHGHECETVRRAGFGSKKNGELLFLAEGRWDVLLTSDRNIQHQQNIKGRNISIVIPARKQISWTTYRHCCPCVWRPSFPSGRAM